MDEGRGGAEEKEGEEEEHYIHRLAVPWVL